MKESRKGDTDIQAKLEERYCDQAPDVVGIAALLGGDHQLHKRLTSLLRANGIPCWLKGSKVYVLLVDRPDEERALDLLKGEHKRQPFWVEFPEDWERTRQQAADPTCSRTGLKRMNADDP